MNNLGTFYEHGLGVPQDHSKARAWFEKAVARGDFNAKIALRRLTIAQARLAGRYGEALQLQEAIAADVEAAETKRIGTAGRQTADHLAGLAWQALFARKFEKALAASDRSIAIAPNNLAAQSNRAHALLFLERPGEAKTIYLRLRGNKILDGMMWSQGISDDFNKLRNAGLSHPLMAEMEKVFNENR